MISCPIPVGFILLMQVSAFHINAVAFIAMQKFLPLETPLYIESYVCTSLFSESRIHSLYEYVTLQREVYPSVVFFPAERNKVILYEGETSVTDITEFLARHANNSREFFSKSTPVSLFIHLFYTYMPKYYYISMHTMTSLTEFPEKK